jgi:purine-nucleoside phosphorylase
MTHTPRGTLADRVDEAAQFVRARLQLAAMAQPCTAIILGSGLAGVTAQMDVASAIPYREVPHLPQTEVEGHPGELLCGALGGVPVMIFAGRVHGYEGFSPDETTFAVRLAAALGTKTLVVTNAAGAIDESLRPGDLIAISDQINLTGENPAAGNYDARFGPRFFDMTGAYSPRLRRLAQEIARAQGWELREGIYLGVQGPSFETPAEIRAFRSLGADMVGMSTVHEVIIARQSEMEVLGISCVTNLAAGVLDQPLSHAEVTEVAASASGRLGNLLTEFVPRIQTG